MDSKKELEPRSTEPSRSVEVPVKPEENLEVSSWVEKIEKQFARVPNDTSDVSDDSVVVQPPVQTDQPLVTLPVNPQQMAKGKKAKTNLGIAWLVTWAIRQIKLLSRLGRKVRLQDLPEVGEQGNKVTK